MRDLCIAIDGFGPVGHKIAGLLLARQEYYASAYGADLRLIAIGGVKTGIADQGGLPAEQLGRRAADSNGVDDPLSDTPDILIVAGSSDTRPRITSVDRLRSAVAAGCDAIVLSSVALIEDGCGLRDLARSTGAILKVSGAIGAALPTIDMLRHNLAGSTIVQVEAIFSPCTNYLLDAMMNCGATLSEALDEAVKQGFVDGRSQADIDGADTARKLLLLATFGLEADLSIDSLTVQGFDALTEQKIAAWRGQAIVPRLVGTLVREAGAIRGAVGIRPFFPGDPMALVRGRCTAIKVVTEEMGEFVVTNCAAEPGAAAAAALKDLEHILKIRSARSLS